MNRSKNCLQCGKKFFCKKKVGIGVWSKTKFCSAKCYWKHDKPKGDKANRWKDSPSYFGIHAWITREYGQPKECQFCFTTNSKKYEWANISKEYKRERNDYIRLCTSCHRKYDEGWRGRTRDSLGRFL